MIIAILILLGFSIIPAHAQTATASPEMLKANELLQAGKWQEAATIYEAILKSDSRNGLAWFNLSWARHGLGKYQDAIDALQKPLELSKGTPREASVMYAMATMYAGLKDKNKALEWLNRAVAAKYPNLRGIGTDPNLAILRDDRRFKDLVVSANKAASICLNTADYRSFDFWLGEWDVFTPNGQQGGRSKVEMLADGCIISENWEGVGGGIGKSYNFYNPISKKWHQSYMDNNGANWMMDGELKDGVLRYEGAIYSPNGKVLVHMTFYNLGPDKVRQTAETSNDDGKTWKPIWDGLYVRKK